MFVKLTDRISVAGQIDPGDLIEAAALGFVAVVNNRPEREADDQPEGSAMQAAATAAGLRYTAIPIDHSGFTMAQIETMAAVLDDAPVLAWCRSGTRSANLWALAEAWRRGDPEAIVAAAASGRYDVSMLLPTLRKLAARP